MVLFPLEHMFAIILFISGKESHKADNAIPHIKRHNINIESN